MFEDDFLSPSKYIFIDKGIKTLPAWKTSWKSANASFKICTSSWTAGIIKIMLMKAFLSGFPIHFNENDMQQQFACRKKARRQENVSLDVFFILDYWGINYVGKISAFLENKAAKFLQRQLIGDEFGRSRCQIDYRKEKTMKNSKNIFELLSKIKWKIFILIASCFFVSTSHDGRSIIKLAPNPRWSLK